MITIFAGFDHSGKTTLATKLKNSKYNFEYYRSTHQQNKTINLEEAIKHDWRFLLDILQQININIIFDRSFICQYVYSLKFRKDSILNQFKNINKYFELFEEYCKILSNINHRIIFCYRNFYDTFETDNYVDLNLHKEMTASYKDFLKKYSKYLNIINCEFEDGIQFNFNKILENL